MNGQSSMSSTFIAKFDIYHVYGVWVNPNVKGFQQAQMLDQYKTC